MSPSTPSGASPGAPERSGIVAGAPFEVLAPVGTGWESAPRRPGSAANRQLDFEKVVGTEEGLLFWLSGQLYRLRSAEVPPPKRSDDVAIPAHEVSGLLERGARQNGNNVALAAALVRATSELRSSLTGEPELLLFETRPKFIVAPPLVVQLPPEERKTGVAVEELTWIEIEFQDEDGKPVSGGRYRLELPDSTVRTGTVPKAALLSFDKLPEPGLCHLKLFAGGWNPGGDASADHRPQPQPDEPGDRGADLSPDDGAGEEVALFTLECVLQDTDGKPLAGLKFEATFSDGTVRKGTTDGEGRIHLEDCPAEDCQLKFLEAGA